MMNDPLKDFVARHREAFDDLDAPEFRLDLLRARQEAAQPKAKVIRFTWKKWAAAAAIILMAGVGFLIYQTQEVSGPAGNQQAAKKTIPVQPKVNNETTGAAKVSEQLARVERPRIKPVKQTRHITPAAPAASLFDERLADSSSASNRLAAILDIDKSGLINEHLLNQLAKTLEKDGNSNVRLAALGVMSKYRTDSHVSGLLVNALNNQKDPMVQLALVNLLGHMDNVKIEEGLYALVNNPETINAVKDEAYGILMKENK